MRSFHSNQFRDRVVPRALAITDANFGCSKLNALVLIVPGVAEVEGRFHYYRQNFWIEDLVGGNGITVDEHKLAVGEIVPIVSGARLRIGDTIFRATIEP